MQNEEIVFTMQNGFKAKLNASAETIKELLVSLCQQPNQGHHANETDKDLQSILDKGLKIPKDVITDQKVLNDEDKKDSHNPMGKMKCIRCGNDNYSSKEAQSNFQMAEIEPNLVELSIQNNLDYTIVMCSACCIAQALFLLGTMLTVERPPGHGEVSHRTVANALQRAGEQINVTQNWR